MGNFRVITLLLALVYFAIANGHSEDTINAKSSNDETEKANEWLTQYNATAEDVYYKNNLAGWTYNTNITDYNLQQSNEADAQLSVFQQEAAANASIFDTNQIQDEETKRLLKKLSKVGIKLSKDDSFKLSALVGNMTGVFSTAKICSMSETDHVIDCEKMWALDPELEDLLAKSRDYDLLKYAWESWRDVSGKPIKNTYKQFVDLSNQGARNDGFEDTGAWWRSWYEDPTFEEEIEKLWYQVLPLYEQLYAYVRKTLRDRVYFSKIKNVLPAHVLGNMWAQEWTNIFDLTVPYPNKTSVDVSQAMLDQNYTPLKMFDLADKFFQSLGLIAMPKSFYDDSMIEKPENREVVCHASAWDFYNRHDFRIKMCTKVNMADLVTIHHEMGHIEYYLQYATQPIAFREGANPGFHEAIGDTIAISVSTPKHLQEIGLLQNYQQDTDQDINFLFKTALDKIAFLPFGYLIDLWRWNVFNGRYDEKDWNDQWWQLRYKYQGLKSPSKRNQDDFDAGSKFHVPANTPYMRYFVAHILQFQFYKEMCNAAKHQGPLYECDFYKNEDAGKVLAKMLQMGSSKPWPDVIQTITGNRTMSAQPLIDYFQPLITWLKEQNKEECFGWGYQWPEEVMETLSKNRCQPDYPQNDEIDSYLEDYNKRASKAYNDFVWAEWKFWTNINEETQKAFDAASVAKDAFDQTEMEKVKSLDASHVTDPLKLRQLKKIGALDLSFNSSDSQTFHSLVSTMTNIYSVAYVCNQSTPNCGDSTDPTQKWAFNPTIDQLMAKSRDYDLLAYVWKGWRDATGAKMLPIYQHYAQLGDQGAQKAGYADMAESWRSPYEDAHFQQNCQDLWRQILPLYEQLHAYVRRQLKQKFYAGKFNTSAIPAHILGNMWSQEWVNLFDDTAPYPDQPSVDVSPAMRNQSYTPKKMFETAQDFFYSIGLFNMTQEFWANSMIEKPSDRDVDCWADAEEFYNGKDYGIKMCAEVQMTDLITIHHEMGHIEYFMSYSDQPIKFHDGANPGFHEAIGDTIALSVGTPGHLQKIGLLSGYDPDSPEAKKQNINFLYKTALEKIAFLPYGYLIDQFRWQVFDGSIPLDKLNDGWWTARKQYQGVVPPMSRSNEDFDAGAKYHVAANVPYIAYFVSHILQFQFHEALCKAAKHTGSLDTCDIYMNKDAGTLLKDMLALGSSKPWPEALKQIAGIERMDAGALVEYFKPLMDWLNETNTRNNECYGWGQDWPDFYDLPEPRCGKYMYDDVTTPTPATTPAQGAMNILAPSYIFVLTIGLMVLIRRQINF
jgi:peptidyl-dipeptidase A